MDPFRRESSGSVRRSPGTDFRWQVERSDSGWGNRAAFAALTDDGQVIAWGDPTSGGSLDDVSRAHLTREEASPDAPWIWTVELASSTAAFAARRANGQVVAWGDAGAGGAIPAELQTALSSGVVRLFGLGRSFVALKQDGSVLHWGDGRASSVQASGLDLNQPYQVVTSFDALAILQNGRVVGCWGGAAGAQQWAGRADLRSVLASSVQELVCNDAGFAARTASGQVVTWGVPQGIGDASGVSITSRPDIVSLGSDTYQFQGFDSSGKIYIWGGYERIPGEVHYVAGGGPVPWGYFYSGPISNAERMFAVPGGGIGWWFKDDSILLYQVGSGAVYQGSNSSKDPVFGGNGLAVIRNDGSLETFGFQLNLASPNSSGAFSPSSKASDASWQAARATGGAFAALASDGQIGLWGEPSKGASPANPGLLQQLLKQNPATQLYSNAGAFVAVGNNGTAISWGDGATGGDSEGAPLIFSGIHHLVSPWQNVRIDDLGPGLLSLIANGQANPAGQSTPLRVREGDRLSAVISGDPNGDRADTTGNLYLWSRNDQPAGAATETQASINLDALSQGTWRVTPTYLDLPGFSRTLAPLSVQVEKIDNGQSRILIQPYSFNGPADQAFSAGNGKVAELVASLSGDPEGIRSIDRVQWFRDGAPIQGYGTNERSILLATEPGDYRFEATTTDNQGYTTTQSSGLVRIDPAGSVPSQGHLALGGLQTLWRLAGDGRSVERFDSSSLRLRPVDMGNTAGYLAISASSDGRAWALDNEGIACVYDDAGNRFIRLDGSGLDANNPDSTLPNLGSGWRQLIAARGSTTAPSLWLLGDIPQNGGSNVAYLPGIPAPGQTLADLKPVVVNSAPALRLLAVGDDQTPWGIDTQGALWSWDAASGSFNRLAAGVGSHIRQLQMVDQGQVWALDEQGVLQMWNGEQRQFTPVPLNSPFWTRRNPQLTAGVAPTWESFALSPMGGFVGIARSGVNLPVGGSGLVAFDTSEIRMLRDPSETISQLQLITGETLQDNGVRQVGQNLAFNLNNQVNVAYMLSGSKPGEWEGAAVVPKAQSGANLRLDPGPNRDAKGTRLPVLKLSWLSGLGSEGQQAYGSRGYVSPFGGLVFEEAALLQPSARTTAALGQESAGLKPSSQGVTSNNITPELWLAHENIANLDPGSGTKLPVAFNNELAWLIPNRDGGSFRYEELKNWKYKGVIRGRFGPYLQPGKPTIAQERIELRYEMTRSLGLYGIRKKIKPAEFIGGATLDLDPLNTAFEQISPEKPEDQNPSIGIYFYLQLDAQHSFPWPPEFKKFSIAAGAEARLTLPVLSKLGGNFLVSLTLGTALDYQGILSVAKPKNQTLVSDQSAIRTENPDPFPIAGLDPYPVEYINKLTGKPADSKTPLQDLTAVVSTDWLQNHPIVRSLQEILPVVDIMVDYIAPAAKLLSSIMLPGGPDAEMLLSPSRLNPPLSSIQPLAFTLATLMEPALLSKQEREGDILDATPIELPSAQPLTESQWLNSLRLRPYPGAQLQATLPAVKINIHLRYLSYFVWSDSSGSFQLQPYKGVLRTDIEFNFLIWSFRERIDLTVVDNTKKMSASRLGSSHSSAELAVTSPGTSIQRRLNAHLVPDSQGSVTPIAEIIPKRRSPDVLLPGQQLRAGEYLISANGKYIALMQADGNLVVQALYTNGSWAQSFTLNDYRDRNNQKATITAGTTLELRDGQLTFAYANGEIFTLDGGTYQRGWDPDKSDYYRHSVTTLQDHNKNTSGLWLTNDGVLEGRYSDGSKFFGFDRYYEREFDLSTQPIPGNRLSGFISLQQGPVGIGTRLLPGNTGLFELIWMRGTLQTDGLTTDWDPSSAQPIRGTEGYTSNVTLIELSDGRLAVSGSHIAADDPLLEPITQLLPGLIFSLRLDQVAPGSTTVLDARGIATKTLPSNRVWAQLGSSLASSSRLRSDWIGDSLILGASGTNHGAGMLYIVNGLAVSQLDDLSVLEDNSRAGQGGWGLVIHGSDQSGSLSGLGQRVINGGDTNGDGFNEIFASAPHNQNGAGLVYMLYGGKALEDLPQLAGGSINLDTLDNLQSSWRRNLYLQSFSGVSGTSEYGSILTGGADLNGDSHSDPLMGYAASSTSAGSVELWLSRKQLKKAPFTPGAQVSEQQAIPHFDRSLLVSARSSEARQSDLHIYAAASVGDLNGDGDGDIVLSSDSRAALVFGDGLMPVYWEASTVLGSIAAANDAISAIPLTQTWTASWLDSAGARYVLSFAGADRNADGLISTASLAGANPEIDWLALRRDGDPSDPQSTLVVLSPEIAHHWSGALLINAANLSFNIRDGRFSEAVSLSAAESTGGRPFSWSSSDSGIITDQAARSLRARLLTSNAPGVLQAAGSGDFNGDGRPDLALSQAGVRVTNSDGSALERLPGQTAVLFGDLNLASSNNPLAMEQVLEGSVGGQLLSDSGGELSAIGDWNSDGKADLLIREPFAPGANGAEQAGSNVVLFGRADSAPRLQLSSELQAGRAQILQGSASSSLTGASAAAGDFGLLIGAPNTIRESDLRRAAAGVRVLTATQNPDGSWQTPQLLPTFEGAASGLQQLSSFTAVGNRILATWVHSRPNEGTTVDELWAAFQDPSTGTWTAAQRLQSNRRGDPTTPSIGEVQALALSDAEGQASGGVLLAWTTLDPVTERNFLFQSTYTGTLRASNWSVPVQQDPDALLLANQDAISGSQLTKLQLNSGTPNQQSQIWAEASVSSEGQGAATIKLLRSGDLSQALTLSYSTRDRSASAGSQYVHSSGTLHFEAGMASASVAIPLIDNDLLEHRPTEFVVDFSLPEQHAQSAQLLLGNTPITTASGIPVLSVRATTKDNDGIQMRAIDAGISLAGPTTGSTGAAASASTAMNSHAKKTLIGEIRLSNTIALVADPGANEGLGQVYALFVAATSGSTANPGMDWKELNDINWLDQPTDAQQGDQRQLNVLIQPEEALKTLDPRAGFGTAMAKLSLNGATYFAISAPGNPLDGTKPSRVYVVSAETMQEWADKGKNPVDRHKPLILSNSNALIIEQSSGGLFGAVLSAGDLDDDSSDELIIGAPGASTVTMISGGKLLGTGRKTASELAAHVISDLGSDGSSDSSEFGSAITMLDLDDDQKLDLAIGAPKANPVRGRTVFEDQGPVLANAGAVYVIKGTGELDSFKAAPDKQLTLKGFSQVNERGDDNDPPRPASEGPPPPGSFAFGEELGSALAAVDLNNDGIKDLAVGAPQYTPDGTLRTGRVITWFGNKATPWGPSGSVQLHNTIDSAKGISFVGQQGSARVGASLASAGDLQHDGNDDLAIGAPFEDGGAGRVYVAFGSSNRYSLEALKVTGNSFRLDSTNPDSPFQTFEAPDGYQLGQSVMGLGDVNNDSSTGIGGTDLFLGSPSAVARKETRQENGDIAIVPSGQTHMAWGRPWMGPNQSLDVPFTQGVGYLLPFGGVPLALGDLNGDGYGDYALLGENNDWLQTDPPDPSKQSDATKLRIRFGAAVEYEQRQLLLSSFALKPAGTPLASDRVPLVVAGDFDGDAFGDLIAYTNDGLKLLHGAPNLSAQGDAQTRWNTAGTPLNIGGSNDPISQLASGDFDGDGFDDLAVVNQGLTLVSANPLLSLFWGSATGLQFGGSKSLPKGQISNNPGIDGLITLDSNGDGIDELALYGNDLATFWSSTPKSGWGLQLLTPIRNWSDPFKKAVQSLPIETGPSGVPSALSSGDLNGDGFADLLIDHGGNKINVLTGNRQTFLQPANLGLTRSQGAPDGSPQRSQLARFIGDVNADGRDDLLFSPTSPSPLTPSNSALKYGPYSFVYLGSSTSTGQSTITVPAFWDLHQDKGTSTPDRLKTWAEYGYTIESLPGEATAYRTGGLGDIDGDGFNEFGFSSNQLYVNGKAEQRPHSVVIDGTFRLTPEALKTTTSNDGTGYDDTLHQLGSAGKQELLLRGKAGSDLLQVNADPYGATLSIPSSGENAGRLTVSASDGTPLWTQPRNPYELLLREGQLQIIDTASNQVQHSWGGGEDGAIDRLYVDPYTGWLYGMDSAKAYLNGRNDVFINPDYSSRFVIDRRSGFSINLGFYAEQWDGFTKRDQLYPADTANGQLVFFPESGKLVLANRGGPDLKNRKGTNTDALVLYEGSGTLVGQERYTQVLHAGESLLSEAGASRLAKIPITSLGNLEASRNNLTTFLTDYTSPLNPNAFGLLRNDNKHAGEGGMFSKSLQRVLGDQYKSLDDRWAWLATANASGQPLTSPTHKGPIVVAMDGNGQITINAQIEDANQIKPGSVLDVLHPGNPDPFLPPIGSEPVLLRPGLSSDQITQAPTGSRSTKNNFVAVLKGGLDDDRLGVDALQRIGSIDGGPGVDTLFFSSQRSDGSGSAINLVGLGSRIRNIEAIEIPINNTLILDEAPLLNTPLHSLKLNSRGKANVIFHVREEYVFVGDQFDGGLAYRVYAKPNSNLQLWVQQGRVTLVQPANDPGRSASLTALQDSTGDTLKSDAPIDDEGLAFEPNFVYRWYYNGKLIEGATEASYGDEATRTLTAGSYTRETDYTDSAGLRKTVSSAPIEVMARPAGGGTLRILRTELDPAQSKRLSNRQSGLSPQGDQLQLLLTLGGANETPAVQRVDISRRTGDNTSPGGLIALVNLGLAWPEAVGGAGAYDFTGDGSLDTLTWQPSHGSSVGDNLHAALLQGSRAQLAALPNGLLGFVVQDPVGSVRGVDIAALQSLRVSLLAAPLKASAVLAIALNDGENLTDLSNAVRQQRAFTLLSHQDVDGAPLTSGADRQRRLWLRADQQLVLFELPGKTLSDWDGSLASEPLRPIQQLPQSGIAGARLQMGSNSGLLLELETLDTPQDLNSFVGRSQTQAPVLDFRGLDGLSLQANLEVAREAAYNSTMGFYAIDGLDGSIRDPLTGERVAPGDPNYGALATANRVPALDGLSSSDRRSTSRSFQFTESRLLAPYAVIADPQLGAQTYYGFAAANPDGIGHFRSFGNNVIGLEDQGGGGDLDYDDNLIHLQLMSFSL